MSNNHGAAVEAVAKSAASDWKALKLLNFYRLALAGSLLVFHFGAEEVAAGRYDPGLFLFTDLVYLVFGVVSAFSLVWRAPAFKLQVMVQIPVDIVAVYLIAFSSGGIGSGLEMLLVTSMAASSIFFPRRAALALAAAATLLVLGEQVFDAIRGGMPEPRYTHAGALGAAFFGVALLSNFLARRIRESEALAAQRGVDLANMAQLNDYIIQRIESGILVIDEQERIHLMNEAAWHLLGMPTKGDAHVLDKLSPELYEQLQQWRRNLDYEPRLFRIPSVVSKILPRFAKLGQRENAGTLIYLDDSALMTKRAQDLKLTSLGRLTASIAHEIRNPLGAISHAAQLLEESPNLNSADRRLTQIVREQSARMNTIIENIMQLSRRDRTASEALYLKPWLDQFVDDFVRTQGIDPAQIEVAIDPPRAQVWMDPSHLHQILYNLCQNGLRHGAKHPGNPKLKLHGGVTLESRGPFLNVIDFGPGIDPEVAQNIFEPFFTTEPQGTGLGLYIARELCECNQAHLEYIPTPTGGSCFRITFVDPKRRGA